MTLKIINFMINVYDLLFLYDEEKIITIILNN